MSDFSIQEYSVVILSDRAQVILYEDTDITQESRRVVLRFQPNGGEQVSVRGTSVVADMNLGLLEPTVDLLRNEDPVHVVWSSNRAYVYAGPEPVGEGD